MSRVYVFAADSPMPLANWTEQRSKTVTVPADGDAFAQEKVIHITYEGGFRVTPLSYYRPAVEKLGYSMKPCRYELELEEHEHDLERLLEYLRFHLSPGESVELWNLWIGVDRSDEIFRYEEKMSSFTMETLKRFLEVAPEHGTLGQCCMRVSV